LRFYTVLNFELCKNWKTLYKTSYNFRRKLNIKIRRHIFEEYLSDKVTTKFQLNRIKSLWSWPGTQNVRLIHDYFVSEIKGKRVFKSSGAFVYTSADNPPQICDPIPDDIWMAFKRRSPYSSWRRNTTRQENKVTAGGKYEHFDREWFSIIIQGCFEWAVTIFGYFLRIWIFVGSLLREYCWQLACQHLFASNEIQNSFFDSNFLGKKYF